MAILANTRTCEMCKATVPSSSVKLYPKERGGTWLLCEACCENMKQKKNTRQPVFTTGPRGLQLQQNAPKAATVSAALSAASPASMAAAPKPAAQAGGSRAAFVCTRCSYKFHDDKSKLGGAYNLVCPYCGKSDRLSRC